MVVLLYYMNKNKKGSTAVIVLLVILILLVVGVFLYSVMRSPTPSAPSASKQSPTAPSVSETTPTTNTAVPQNNSYDTFITAAQTCTPAKANLTITQNSGAGFITIFNEQAQIIGPIGSNCHFFSTRVGADMVADQNLINQGLKSGQVTQAYVDSFEQALPAQAATLKKNNIGMTQDCNFSPQNLVAYLNVWKNGSTDSSGTFASVIQKSCIITPPKK